MQAKVNQLLIILQNVGPFILDTTPPLFVGSYIDLYVSEKYLVANWSSVSFIDSDNPFPLDYEFTIGKYH